MALELYPSDVRGLAFTVTKRPEFRTIVQASPSFNETRIAQSQNPIWHWTLIYDYLYNSSEGNRNNALLAGRNYPDLQLLLGFFLSNKGKYAEFLFEDPDDKSVGPALDGGDPNPKAELQLIQDSDSGLWYSPIQRNMGGQFYEDITDLNGEIVVYANGVRQSAGAHYSVGGPGFAIPGYSWAGLVIVWADGYVPEGPITAEFEFYFRVRFATDDQDFEKFLSDVYTIGGHGKNGRGYLELQSVRPPMCEGNNPEAPPEILLSGCGLLAGEWRHNLRAGPFYGPGDSEWWGIFVETGRIVAKQSTDNMETWSTVDDVQVAPTPALGSVDAQVSGDDLLVEHQQTNGRTAYSRFNRGSATWEAIDKEIIASANIASGNEGATVSVVLLSTGDIGAFYATDRETVSGTPRRRCGFRYTTDDGDTWSAEEQIGHWGQATHDTPARGMPDNDGRVLFHFGNADTPFFGHIYCQTRAADTTLSAVHTVFTGGALSQVQIGRCVGDYCGFVDGGDYKIAVPYRTLDDARYAIFTASDDMTPDFITKPAGDPTIFLGNGAGGALYPMLSLRMIDGVLHMIGEKFTNTFGAHLWHKTAESPWGSGDWAPAGVQHGDKAGPEFDNILSGQCMGATIEEVPSGSGNFYIASFQASTLATPNVLSSLIPLSRLPLPDSLTLDTWLDECNIEEGG